MASALSKRKNSHMQCAHVATYIKECIHNSFPWNVVIAYYFLLSVVSCSASSDLTHTCRKFKKENHFCFRVTYLLCYSTQETSVEHLGEALQTLVAKQQDLSLRAARSTLSLHRLNQRLVVLEWYFIALSRKGLSSGVGEVDGGEEGDKIVELPESKEQFVKEEGR